MSQKLDVFNDPNCSSLNITILNANNSNTVCLSWNESYPIYATCVYSRVSVTICPSFNNANLTIPSNITPLPRCRPLLVNNYTKISVLYIKQGCGNLDWSGLEAIASTTTLPAIPTAINLNPETTSPLSTSAIAGITLGIVVLFLVILFIIWFIYKRKSIKKKSKPRPYVVSLDRRTSRILRERDSINSRFSNPLSLGKPEAKQAAVDHFKVHQRTIVSGQPDLNLPSSPILHSEHDFTFDIDFDNHSDSFVINSQAFHLISGLVNPPGNVLPVTSSGCQERNASIVKVEQWVDGSELGSISESSMSRW